MAIIGTETEYGILAPDEPAADPEVLSAAVVDSYPGPGTPSLAETHNRVLANGARLYVDHGHPEYSTPEATNAADATALTGRGRDRPAGGGRRPAGWGFG